MPPLKHIPGHRSYLSTNRQLELANLLALTLAGIVIKLMFNSANPANATIWGYGLSSMSLFLLLMISFALANHEEMKAGLSKFMEIFSQYALPTLLLLLLLAWSIVLNITYSDKINGPNLPSEFNLYSLLSSIVILLQTVVLFLFYDDKFNLTTLQQTALKRQAEEVDSTKNSTITYIFTLINALLIGMMQIVLTFFTTDG
jgi:hypothetical protein